MARTTRRTTPQANLRPAAIGLLVIAAAILGSLVFRSGSTPAVPVNEGKDGERGRRIEESDFLVTEQDGELPHGVSVFDTAYVGVANLDPGLLEALWQAARDAAEDRVVFHVNSGWRSRWLQDQLFREAVSEYGSAARAARWVATADTSLHVSGDAVDIGPVDAMSWLSQHGARYGLCQVYGNEPWHYELRPNAITEGCPAPLPDASHDPRMQPMTTVDEAPPVAKPPAKAPRRRSSGDR